MKYILILAAMVSTVPVFADNCFDGGVRFRSFADTGGGEVYLGQPDLGVAGNRIEQNLHWNSGPNPQTEDFVFTYDLSGNIGASIPGQSTFLATTTPAPNVIEGLFVQLASRDDNSQVELLDLTVNAGGVETVIGDFAGAGLNQWVYRVNPAASYTVTGTIRYSGPFSNSQERSRIEIRLGEDECGLLPPPPLPEAVPVHVGGPFVHSAMAATLLLIGWTVLRRKS